MAANLAHVALYCQGTFDVPNPTPSQVDAMLAAASDIASSGFGTVILGQWHVHPGGSIYYNDSPLDTVIQTLKVIPDALGQGGIVENVLLTFGPFGSDFQAIKQNLASFEKTMAGVQAMTAINGLDWDLEQDYDQFSDLLVELTQWANGLGMMVTAAPYQSTDFWKKVLEQTNTGGSAGFSWWNLQLYGGADYGSWVSALQGLVPDPQSFLVPGFSVSQGSTPASVQSALASLEGTYPSLDGGFIWKYEDIVSAGYTASSFAQAIEAGVAGSPARPAAKSA